MSEEKPDAKTRAENYGKVGRKLMTSVDENFGRLLLTGLASGWAIARELATLNHLVSQYLGLDDEEEE